MKSKFISFLFLLGFIVSLICGFVVGNRIMHIITMSLICGVALSAVGFAVYTILEKKVPEFIEFLEDFSIPSSSDLSFEGGGDLGDDADSSKFRTDLGDTTSFSSESAVPVSNAKQAGGKFGDHIMVDNIPIKNEPKLMAEAIRTFMAMDEPSAPPK